MAAYWTLTIPRRVAQPTGNGLASLLKTWWRRAQERRSLADLDDQLLRDCGITREQARVEIEKPFWIA